MRTETKKSIIVGFLGSLGLFLIYFLILTLANSFSHALEQFYLLWPWMSVLIIGFGAQVGLYSHIRRELRQRKEKNQTNKELAASAGLSTGSMVACCAHHLVDVLPIIGLSAAFLFLVKYQILFIILGILANIIGIIFMLDIVKKYSLYREGGLLSQLAKVDVSMFKKGAILASTLILFVSFFWIKSSGQEDSMFVSEASSSKDEAEILAEAEKVYLAPRTNSEGGLSIEIGTDDFYYNEPIKFNVSLNTHSGDLDFDLSQKASLIDNFNKRYEPIEWQGEKGGHHLSGQLIFPPLNQEVKKIKILISDVYEVKERIFEWDLK